MKLKGKRAQVSLKNHRVARYCKVCGWNDLTYRTTCPNDSVRLARR